MCVDQAKQAADALGTADTLLKRPKKVSWQSKFEDLTGKTPDDAGVKTEEEARGFVQALTQKRTDSASLPGGTVLTGYQGPLGVH